RLGIEAERLALPPVDLARPALETVPDDCFPDLLGRGDTDARLRQAVSGEEDDRISGKDFSARFVNPKKLATFRQPLLFGEGGVGHEMTRPPGACGPCGDGAKAPPVRPSSASGRGNRACACGGGCSAEKFASLQ